MFDILAYVVERYFDLGAYPEQETLSRQLAVAGFEQQEIRQALQWLSALDHQTLQHIGSGPGRGFAGPASLRHYAEAEQGVLGAEGRGFLQFLESVGTLDAMQRELVIDRVMALSGMEIGLDELKLVVLLVLWTQGQPPNSLILDELRVGERVATLH